MHVAGEDGAGCGDWGRGWSMIKSVKSGSTTVCTLYIHLSVVLKINLKNPLSQQIVRQNFPQLNGCTMYICGKYNHVISEL